MPNATTRVVTENGDLAVTIKSFGPISKADTTASNVEDPFEKMYSGGQVIPPPYDLMSLASLREYSDMLSSCISAMQTNVDGFGWELKPADHVEIPKGALPPELEAEKRVVETLLNFCNPRQNFTMLREELRVDLEETGNAYMEVVRNRKGDVAEFYRLPAHSVRLTPLDKEFTSFTQSIRGSDGQFQEMPRNLRFRRYIQIINGLSKVYFKEFGDPRLISKSTGKVLTSGTRQDLASEVIPFRIFCSHSPYGQPRWIGALMKLLGSYKADQVNYLFFDNKTIPPIVITVSGGSLTDATIKELRDTFQKEIKGVQNFHKALVLEATPVSGSIIEGEKLSPVKIDFKPLTGFIRDDAMFLKYVERNDKAIRSCFKLSPIFTGNSEDYTRATAKEAIQVTEEQVFIPERRREDYTINRTIMADLRINNWTFRTLGARTSSAAEILEAVAPVKEAIPVGVLMELAAEVRNVPVGEIDERWYEIPLGLMYSALTPGTPESEQTDPNAEPTDPEVDVEKFVDKMMALRKSLLNRIEKEDPAHAVSSI